MRGKRLKFNTVSSLIYQVTAVICGFILPRLILSAFGSQVNGLVNSIMQFLQIITFMELGVGAVVQSALYKPLAEKDSAQISKIFASAQRFFRKIAQVLLVYVVVLMAVYPFAAHQDFGFLYTALLIASISISTFAQYYFGIVNSLLLTADQRGYIQNVTQTAIILLNTLVCAILIYAGAGIHVVKLTTSIIYLLRPLVLNWYVDRHYNIDRKIKYAGEPISQKWNGIAQHISAVVLDGTDAIVLTVFSSLSNVSIYSVYNMVVYGIKSLFLSLTNGVQSLIGELWAKQELKTLDKTFDWFEWVVHTGTVFVFGCTGVLIVPFVSVYTSGITDAEYIQPLFAVLLTMAGAGHCLRLPYNVMILAGGHYKQTQRCYITAAALNVAISIAAVIPFGLVGVAIGTLAAMTYQTVWMAHYISKDLIKWPMSKFLRQLLIDTVTVIAGVMATSLIGLSAVNYLAWFVMAVKVAAVWLLTSLAINAVFCRDKVKTLLCKIRH